MKTSIAIIGGGFSGTILTRHLIELNESICITVFNYNNKLSKGVAYDCNQKSSLLNVPAGKISAFSYDVNHFLKWCLKKETYKNDNPELIAGAFLPRQLYGEYLNEIWGETVKIAKEKTISLQVLDEKVNHLALEKNRIHLQTENSTYHFDKCVIATGNELPGKPKNIESEFLKSDRYFNNPWNVDYHKIDKSLPILIIGNGLTMVDIVLNLRDNKLYQKIISISPNGFNILPHRNFGFTYNGALANVKFPITLLELITLFNREMKNLKKVGVSPDPIIDALRPNTQKIWQQFTAEEKAKFMSRVRHLWGVARHRIPFVSYDSIMKEQVSQQLNILAGKITSVQENNDGIEVKIWDKRSKREISVIVGAIVNCTGPETNITKSNNVLLNQLYAEGIIDQDPLFLGININCNNFKTLQKNGAENQNIYAIGSLLKGELWETTAVSDLRVQAKELAQELTKDIPKT
ncbi:MAG: hypothetical protein EBS86_04695 [Crocinitomicaceae bacterium]|nr:hypothetical protein [Crocinitomicaceae bacterium]